MITKQLKHGTFSYDEQTHKLIGLADVWNKTYIFAFIRFVLRIAQSEILRKVKKI